MEGSRRSARVKVLEQKRLEKTQEKEQENKKSPSGVEKSSSALDPNQTSSKQKVDLVLHEAKPNADRKKATTSEDPFGPSAPVSIDMSTEDSTLSEDLNLASNVDEHPAKRRRLNSEKKDDALAQSNNDNTPSQDGCLDPPKIHDTLFLRFYCGIRQMLSALPFSFSELEETARRLFDLPIDQALTVEAAVSGVEGKVMEIDPLIWHAVKRRVEWVRIMPVITNPPATFQAFVKVLTGKAITLELTKEDTIRCVKEYIMKKEGVHADLQNLSFSGRLLQDADTCEKSGIQREVTLHLTLGLKGGKPVIYLFSSITLEASVSLRLIPAWSFSAVYPVLPIKSHEQGGECVTWEVAVHPDTTMTEKGSGVDVSYLFWEADTNPDPKQLPSPMNSPIVPHTMNPLSLGNSQRAFDPSNPEIKPNNSILLPIADVTMYLNNALLVLGLHTEARTSFITYWLPGLLKHENIALRFLPQAAYELAAPLSITPTPSSVTRIFMLWKGIRSGDVRGGLNGWHEAVERAKTMPLEDWKTIVGLAPAVEDGLRVLEWGGMEVKY